MLLKFHFIFSFAFSISSHMKSIILLNFSNKIDPTPTLYVQMSAAVVFFYSYCFWQKPRLPKPKGILSFCSSIQRQNKIFNSRKKKKRQQNIKIKEQIYSFQKNLKSLKNYPWTRRIMIHFSQTKLFCQL